MSEDTEDEEKEYFVVPATRGVTYNYFLQLKAQDEVSVGVDKDVLKQLDSELECDIEKQGSGSKADEPSADASKPITAPTESEGREPSEDTKALARKLRRKRRDPMKLLRYQLLIDGFLYVACADTTADGAYSMAHDCDSYSPMADIMFVASNRLFPSALTDIVVDYASSLFWFSELSDTFKDAKMRKLGSGLQVSGGGTVRMRDPVSAGELAVMDVTYVRGAADSSLGGCYFTGVISQATAQSLKPEQFSGSPYYEYSVFKPFGVDDAENCVYTGGEERSEDSAGKQRYRSRVEFRFAVDLRDWCKPKLAFAIPKDNLDNLFVLRLPKADSEEATSWYPIFCPYNAEAYARVQFK